MRLAGRLGPLAERQFRLLFAGRTVSVLGNAIAPIALAFAVLDLTGSKSDLGFVLAARAMPTGAVHRWSAGSGPTGSSATR